MNESIPPPGDHIRLRRFHERGFYDRETILEILDCGLLCHVGAVHDGRPVVIPTLYWHDRERIYFHGSSASRLMRAAEAQPICVTVTHVDGLVLTRSAFHHSANYRSVMILGEAERVAGAEAAEQLKRMMERIVPGRWDQLRPVKPQELKATRILSLPLANASAKIRTGPPDEEAEDLSWPVWAGVLPIRQTMLDPVADTLGDARAFPEPVSGLFRA